MKKVLLFSILISFFVALSAMAYETIIIDFPPKTKWDAVYYKNNYVNEAILQYVPAGQTAKDWKQSVIVHSYKGSTYSAHQKSDIITRQLQLQNPTGKYKYLKYSGVDSVAIRFTNDYKGIKGQGEIFRTTKSAEGIMTIQYIDRDKEHFKKNYNMWLKIIRDVRTYNSYWRDNEFMNKGESFEL